MKELINSVELLKLNGEIKFYFSLFFTSISDYELLVNFFGENIDLFNYNDYSLVFDETTLNGVIEKVRWNNDKIDLSDKTILKLFSYDEIKNNYELYFRINTNFNVGDPKELNRFYKYMMIKKLKEKKALEHGSIYEYFDDFSDEEIINAVTNLDNDDKKRFIYFFGIKGDNVFELNTDNYGINEILIKLYSYMLAKRSESDIPYILNKIMNEGLLKYTIFDYVRKACDDPSISDAFILEMFAKLDYNSKECIKGTFGEKLSKRIKMPRNKAFKKAIDNLIIVIKINKEYRDKKDHPTKHKKSVTEEKNHNLKEDKTEKSTKEKINKEPQKEKGKKNGKNAKNKKSAKKKPKENKNVRLEEFLEENGLHKSDFEKAVKLLDIVSNGIVTMYYGINKEPAELSKISAKFQKSIEEILNVLKRAEKEIVNLIKTGEINRVNEPIEKKEISKTEEKNNQNVKIGLKQHQRLNDFINENNIIPEDLIKATLVLAPIEKVIIDFFLRSDPEVDSVSEVANILNINSEKAEEILEVSTDKIILELTPKVTREKEISKNDGEKPQMQKGAVKKDKERLFNDFLNEQGITKNKFFSNFNKLDSLSKDVLAMYLGIYTTPKSVDEIAARFGRNVNNIDNIIYNAKKNILKPKTKEKNTALNTFLLKNDLSLMDFKNLIKNLPIIKMNIIKSYFGIEMASMSVDDIAKKYGVSKDEVNKMINSALKDVSSSNLKKNKISKLNKFLMANKLTKEQFFASVELLLSEDKELVSRYFGLNGIEMSIKEIALLNQTSSLVVRDNLSSTLDQIKYLASNGVLNNKNQHKFKQKYQLDALFADPNFILLLSSNPSLANNIINMYKEGFDVNETYDMLKVTNDQQLNDLMLLSLMSNYKVNSSTISQDVEFVDREKKIHNELNRRH